VSANWGGPGSTKKKMKTLAMIKPSVTYAKRLVGFESEIGMRLSTPLSIGWAPTWIDIRPR
jgi:hypothetical protein